jgi:Spy/CpxP family protein refolding chaperone
MKRKLRGLLGALTLVVLVGCSSHHHQHGMMGSNSDAYWQKGQQDMASLIDKTVVDPNKAQQVKNLAGEIVNELKAGREQERAYHRQLYTLNTSYAAAPEEFTKVLDEAGQQRMRTSAKVLALRFKMKELMTADEWKTLTDKMLSYSSRYQHGSAGAKTGY